MSKSELKKKESLLKSNIKFNSNDVGELENLGNRLTDSQQLKKFNESQNTNKLEDSQNLLINNLKNRISKISELESLEENPLITYGNSPVQSEPIIDAPENIEENDLNESQKKISVKNIKEEEENEENKEKKEEINQENKEEEIKQENQDEKNKEKNEEINQEKEEEKNEDDSDVHYDLNDSQFKKSNNEEDSKLNDSKMKFGKINIKRDIHSKEGKALAEKTGMKEIGEKSLGNFFKGFFGNK